MARNQYGFSWLQSNSVKAKTKELRFAVNIYGVGDEPTTENSIYCTITSRLDAVWIADNYPLWAYDVYIKAL